MKLIQIIKECSGILPALVVGFYNYRYLNRFAKILFLQLVIWIVVYLISYVITNYQRAHHISQNNQWIFNINMLIETTLLLFSARCFFISEKNLFYLSMVYVAFLSVFTFQIITHGLSDYSSLSDLFESAIFTALFSFILYKLFHEKMKFWFNVPDIWISIGLLFYFACSVPYIAFFDTLEAAPASLSKNLFRIIIDFLANIRYWFFAMGLYLSRSYFFEQKLHQND